ncbi:MAG TPA: hypothetical protein DIU15_15935, partial [Deltaproteobacteria bacterium]|nr:hypothetical protein [Deltaproteobacteria bacterium]
GDSWQAASTGTSSHLRGVADNESNVVIVGDDGLLLASTDGGVSWTTHSLPDVLFRAVDISDSMVAVAVGTDGSISVADLDNPSIQFVSKSSGTTDALESVHFSGNSHAWAVGANGAVVMTTDGGASWFPASPGADVTLEGVHFVHESTGWAVGYEGTILKTSNGGASWTPQMSWGLRDIDGDLGGVTFIDGNTGWVVGGGGVILHTSDGGSTWQEQTSGTTYNLNDVLFTSADDGWVVGAGGILLRTQDGGDNWSTQASGTSTRLRSLAAADSNSLGAVGDNGTFVSSSDGGESWSIDDSVITLDGENLWDLYPTDPTHVWCAGADGGIWATFDSPWVRQDSGVTDNLRSIHFDDDQQKGWAVGRNGTIVATHDAGDSWNSQVSGTQEHFRSVFFADHVTGWAVGDNGTIRATKDGGTTWGVQESGSARDLRSITFVDAFRGWAVGAHGTILATMSGGGPLDALPVGDDDDSGDDDDDTDDDDDDDDDSGDDDDDGTTTCEGSYTVDGTETAADLAAISNCAVITGQLIIQDTSRSHLSPLSNLTSVQGGLKILNNSQLMTLSGLDQLESVGDLFEISGNQSLTSLTALADLTSVGTSLYIENSPSITNLTGLHNLTSIGVWFATPGQDALSIMYMNGLTDLDALASVNYVHGDVTIAYNEALCDASVSEFAAACGLHNGSVTATDNNGACANDDDGDGWLDILHGGTDCDDDAPLINPAATEVCNGVDDDCDGSLDETGGSEPWYLDADGDDVGSSSEVIYPCDSPVTGYVPNGGDCNDSDDSIHPGALDETGDSIDQNCDGWDGVA